MRIRIENLGRVLIFSSCCMGTFIEVFKDNEERFQAVGREIEADARGTDDGEMDLCGVDTCSFLVLSKMLVLWVTVVCLASCSNSSLSCKVGKEEEFEVGKETGLEESKSKVEVDECGDGLDDDDDDVLDDSWDEVRAFMVCTCVTIGSSSFLSG